MSETKHTPGPWIYYADLPSTEPDWHIVTTANKLRLLANIHIEPGNAVDEANARLIAAAPELLAALEALLQANYPAYYPALEPPTKDDARIVALSAIAKAKGETE